MAKSADKGEIILYKARGGAAQVDVRVQDETVWLTAHQMAIK